MTRRLPRRAWITIAVALVVVGTGLTLAEESGASRAVTTPSACTGILNSPYQDALYNTTLFEKVCTQPSFVQAYNLHGVQGFTAGESSQGYGRWVDVYYAFDWTASCTNRSWGVGTCSEQEYWDANVTTGNISGPFFAEFPASCSGCPAGPPALFLIIVVAAILVLAFLTRPRSRRPASSMPGQTPSATEQPPAKATNEREGVNERR